MRQQNWKQSLRDQGLGFKLGLLILLSSALPVVGVTYGIVRLAEHNLNMDLQAQIRHSSAEFGEVLRADKESQLTLATGLAQSIHISTIPLNAARQPSQDYQLQEFLAKAKQYKLGFSPSFYFITDAQGRTIAQDIGILVEGKQNSPRLPVVGGTPWQSYYTPVDITPGIDLKRIKVVREALKRERSFSSLEILDASMLEVLKLDRQAFMPLRAQPIAHLSTSQRPFPENTFPVENGRIGMVMMAIVPIHRNGKLQGTVIVGTLLNRNYALIDRLQEKMGISVATLFAYDMRISTNVPYLNDHSRAIATRGAREPMERVLLQRQPFEGTAFIVDQKYHTLYQPLYDHEAEIDQRFAQPIGIYFVGIDEQKVRNMLNQLIAMSVVIGSSIVLGLGVLAFPLAQRLTRPMRRLTHFAEQVGQQEAIPFPIDLKQRHDEIGILAQSLDAMLTRLDETLGIAQASEKQLRHQKTELQATLSTLQRTQTHLIQSEKMSGLGQLVAGIAHEINNPISFIYGNLHYASEYTEQLIKVINAYQQCSHPCNQKKHSKIQGVLEEVEIDFIMADLPNLFRSMQGGTDRIKQIVQSLRTFSRLDESASKVVNLHDGIDSTVVLLAHRLRPNSERHEILIRQHYGDLPRVECYAREINQVFMNVLNNAIDAIDERVEQKGNLVNPWIEIQTQRLEDGWVQVAIRDNGIGMTDEVRSQIFNPFFTTKPVGSGIGMGLATTYQIIVEHHHGEILAESEVGKGSCLTLRLPSRLQGS
ncbi:MAG: cache domain-containing protein [Synechococcales bacterium]|nr:cache domain-containing protein [Synechococcales bacterium]